MYEYKAKVVKDVGENQYQVVFSINANFVYLDPN